MKIRWMLIALGLATLMTAIAWLPLRSVGGGGETGEPSRPPSEFAASGCAANAKPARLDFTLKDMYGRDVKLADFKGKVLMINFWATWCSPCKAEIPGFVDLQNKYKNRGLEVLGISINDQLRDLEPFAREFNVNYPLLVGLDHDDLIDYYGASEAIPVTVIVGRDGRMCYRKLGLADLDQVEREIKSLL